jgi:gamma-glutamyltranspeptidase/glutathione hydrolase
MKGAIAAGDPQTVAAGAAMLELDGNAVDAAVAAAFASFVAEAVLTNICAGGMALIVDGASQPSGKLHQPQAAVYDFFSTMPSGQVGENADFRRIMVDFGPEQQPFYIGRASAAVPGVVAGLCAMAQRHGRLPLARLVEPAVRLAREGAVLSGALAYVLDILTPIFTDTPELAALFAPGGHVYQAGERMRFPQLAETLERLGQTGPDLFRTGTVAETIAQDQQVRGGLITAHDLAAYQVRHVPPIRLSYRGYTVLLPPPASSGGVLIAFALKLLETMDVAGLPHTSFEHVRMLAEAMRLTNHARAMWEASQGPDEERIGRFLAAGRLAEYQRDLRAILEGKSPPQTEAISGGPNATTHISVVDGQGLVVSLTTSAGENAGFLVGDTGVCLNNMLGEIDLHPGGFHRLPPGARLSTMMSPAVVLRAGKPVLALGSGGSNRLRSAITQVISNVIDFGMPLDEAIDAPRVHFEADVLQVEGGISNSVVRQLEGAGYRVNYWPDRNMFFGGAHAVAQQTGQLVAAGDKRRGGAMAVVE